jgi:hypothetical protein
MTSDKIKIQITEEGETKIEDLSDDAKTISKKVKKFVVKKTEKIPEKKTVKKSLKKDANIKKLRPVKVIMAKKASDKKLAPARNIKEKDKKFEEAIGQIDFRSKISREDKELINNIISENSISLAAEDISPARIVDKQDLTAPIDSGPVDKVAEQPKTEEHIVSDPVKITVIDEEKDQPDRISESERTVGTSAFRPSVGIYKKIAIFFVLAVMVLAGIVFYFTFKSVTISLIPNQERKNGNMIIDVYDKTKTGITPEGSIAGAVTKVMMENTKIYQATGEEIIGEEVAGRVTLFNNYDKSQYLVATTRLLTPDNKLFRLKETINIPAGGQADADIYADTPAMDMEINPTKFTIPGLWAGLQDKIFAESKEKIIYRKKTKKIISREDLDNSVKDIKQDLLSKAKDKIAEEFGEYSRTIYSIDENSVDVLSDAKAGEEKGEFTTKIKANVILIAFDNNAAAQLAENKFVENLSSGQELLDFNKDEIIYNLSSFNYLDKTASVNATFEGKISLKSDSDVFDRNRLVGLNEKQINDFLNDLQGIAGYEIKFFPKFIKTAPSLPEKIIIEIKK